MRKIALLNGNKKIKISKREIDAIGKESGWTRKAEIEADLFEFQEFLPENIQGILDRFSERHEDHEDQYLLCKSLIEELEQNGYTADYDLDGMPFGLKKLEGEGSPDDLVSRRRTVAVTMSDGEVITTDINGNKKEIEDYYLTNEFVANDEDTLRKGINVEFLD